MVLGDQDWIDCGSYWLHKYPQLTDPWKDERSFRLTTTNFSPIVNPSFYRGPDDVIRYYSGPPAKKSFTDQLASDCGLRNEPKGRDWYSKEYRVEVKEVGLAVPKWDPRLGASIDGDVVAKLRQKPKNGDDLDDELSFLSLGDTASNGMIEIKCPGRMYIPITKYLTARKQGWRPPEGYHAHIFDSHFDQMQGSMAITDKQWCDYVVYCLAEEHVFVDRVYFDPRYWHNTMYPKIDAFLNEHETLFKGLRLRYDQANDAA